MRFRDRTEAGVKLAGALQALRAEQAVVLGFPCGGMPVAYEIALALGAPLGILLVRADSAARTIHAPPPGAVLSERELAQARVACALRVLAERQPSALARRVRAELPRAITGPTKGAPVILVDDLIVTGQRARAACEILRWRGATRVVVAAPVMARGAAGALADVAADVVCLQELPARPGLRDAYAEGGFVSEAEVIGLLGRASTSGRLAGTARAAGAWSEDGAAADAASERRTQQPAI